MSETDLSPRQQQNRSGYRCGCVERRITACMALHGPTAQAVRSASDSGPTAAAGACPSAAPTNGERSAVCVAENTETTSQPARRLLCTLTWSAAMGKTFRPTSTMLSRWLRPSETCARFPPVRACRDAVRFAAPGDYSAAVISVFNWMPLDT